MTWSVQPPLFLRSPWPRFEWTEHAHNFFFFFNKSIRGSRACRTEDIDPNRSMMIRCTTSDGGRRNFFSRTSQIHNFVLFVVFITWLFQPIQILFAKLCFRCFLWYAFHIYAIGSSWVIQTRVMSVEMDAQSCIQIVFLIITPSLDKCTPAFSLDMRVISLRWILPDQFNGEQ